MEENLMPEYDNIDIEWDGINRFFRCYQENAANMISITSAWKYHEKSRGKKEEGYMYLGNSSPSIKNCSVISENNY